ncbi:hypothetical protein CYMTET_40343 [Cymbomonas tetramitiformis]|uniref:Uncharacterized protein n=1 Tax=Cymbomonas tetramitiformis TaxID=36881 RepID=A0AAE0C9I9_9CHLO|nr:hypothetical protein CYMTET_40343 [Cymbomonas tetramitiformis]
MFCDYRACFAHAITICVAFRLLWWWHRMIDEGIAMPASAGNRFTEALMHAHMPQKYNMAWAASAWVPEHWNNESQYAQWWRARRDDRSMDTLLHSYVVGNADVADRYRSVALLHYRCSDVPFVANPHYKVQPPQYAMWVARQLQAWNVTRVLPVLCTHHMPSRHPWSVRWAARTKCPAMLKDYLVRMRETAPKLKFLPTRCLGEKETLIAARHASATAQLMLSSFTFIAAAARPDGRFLTPSLGFSGCKPNNVSLSKSENDRLHALQRQLHWRMWVPTK